MIPSPQVILIQNSPCNGNGLPPYGFFHFYKVYNRNNYDDRLLIATLDIECSLTFALQFAEGIAKFYSKNGEKIDVVVDLIQ